MRSVLPSRWKGANILSLSASGTPGPQSITRSSILPLRALAVTSGGAPAGEYRSALAVRFAMTRSMTGGSATTLGSPGGRSTRTVRPDGPRPVSEHVMISSRSAGRGNTDRAPACSRVTSSRVAARRDSTPRDSSAVASSSSWSAAVSCRSGERRQLTAAAAAASGDRRSWLTAASRAARIRSASAIGPAAPAVAAARARPGSARVCAVSSEDTATEGAFMSVPSRTAHLSCGVVLPQRRAPRGASHPYSHWPWAVRGQAGSRSEPSAPGLRVALGRLAGGGWWCLAGRP